MGKNFWPAYIIVAAALLAATWKFAPVVGEKIPAGGRASIRGLVAKCIGHGGASAADADGETQPKPAASAQKPAAPAPAGEYVSCAVLGSVRILSTKRTGRSIDKERKNMIRYAVEMKLYYKGRCL